MLRWILVCLFFPSFLSAQLKRFQFSENKMGSSFNLIFYHPDSAEAISVAKECFKIVDSLNIIFSDYSTASEVSRLSLSTTLGNQPVSDELFGMILKSKEAWEKSGKTFDITIGPLSYLWRKVKNEKRFPSMFEIKEAKQKTGFDNLIMNNKSKTISICSRQWREAISGTTPPNS